MPPAPSPSSQTATGRRSDARLSPRVDLDALSSHWRVAINAAEDAVRAGAHYLPRELEDMLRRQLVEERQEIDQLMQAVAREDGVPLVVRIAAPRATRAMLGLPREVDACVFELEGVLTGSAAVHAAAWADTFEPFLLARAERVRGRYLPFTAFNPRTDYLAYIHGKPRVEGVRAFLASRGIRLPEGKPSDPPGKATVHGLANAKNEALAHRLVHEDGRPYADSRRYLDAAHEAGLGCAVVSASTNTAGILERSGLASAVDARVDGTDIARDRLHGWPAPDVLLAACRKLGVPPSRAAVFETDLQGVAAASHGRFSTVIAVERHGAGAELEREGADVVVAGLADLLDPALA